MVAVWSGAIGERGVSDRDEGRAGSWQSICVWIPGNLQISRLRDIVEVARFEPGDHLVDCILKALLISVHSLCAFV